MNPRTLSKHVSTRRSLVFVSIALACAMAGGCSAAPSAQKEAQGPDQKEGGQGAANGKGKGDFDQFDSGSYNMTRGNTTVATVFVNNQSTGSYKELWVFASCGTGNCDISGATSSQTSTTDSCGTWKTRAETAFPTRSVYGASYISDTLSCATGCAYTPSLTSHSFSVFPAGKYTPSAGNNPRVFVDDDNGTKREYWIMLNKIGAAGTTLSGSTSNDGLSAFACGACNRTTDTMTVYKVTYTSLSGGIDCTGM